MTGRPTDYTDETLTKAQSYVDGGYLKLGHVIPSIVGLTKALNRSRSTIYLWINDPDKAEFSDIVESLLDGQHLALTNGGLTSEFNSSIAKLMLTKHGYSDKQELTGSEGGAIEVDTKWTIEVIE